MTERRMTSTYTILSGLPASGKSTYRKTLPKDTEIISTDDYIDQKAKELGKTYSEVFKDHIKDATEAMQKKHADALKNNKNIAIDRTNLTRSSRASWLSQVPNHYHKKAVWFATPPKEEHERRLSSRLGKEIPSSVIRKMKDSVEIPTREEGFHEVEFHKSFK